MIRSLDHVYYWTRDLDASVAFYRDTLGLPLLRREGDRWAQFDAGPVRFALHAHDGSMTPAPGGIAVFAVDDLDHVRWTLEQRGVSFVQRDGEVPGLARFASLADPDGNIVQLIEYLDGPPA